METYFDEEFFKRNFGKQGKAMFKRHIAMNKIAEAIKKYRGENHLTNDTRLKIEVDKDTLEVLNIKEAKMK